jgi:hypothetical protein
MPTMHKQKSSRSIFFRRINVSRAYFYGLLVP